MLKPKPKPKKHRKTSGVDPARSRQMALVRHQNTKPEMVVRKLVYGLGYRYRLHDRSLVGKPDLVFNSRRKVIFVHGCFWHRHRRTECWRSRLPKSRVKFWTEKLEGNAARDAKNVVALEVAGWQVLIVWECETTRSKNASLIARLESFLSGRD